MRKLKIITVSSLGLLAAVIVMLMLIPREKHLMLSNVLAVLFWIILVTVIFLVYTLLKNLKTLR